MITLLLASLLAWPGAQDASKQDPPKPKIELKYGAQREGRRTDGDMARWRDNRLGVIIHYGLYSQAGGTWNGKNYTSAAEFIKNSAKVPNEDYDKLLKTFNPDRSTPKTWARLIKQMGAKYAVITTKHHEGFCLWPSKYTDFDVESTPYKSDFLGEFVKACDDEGIDVMLYYSIMDWHHKGWRYTINNESDRVEFMKFWEFSALQLEELLERYPKIKGFWFDGTWDSSVKNNGHLTFELDQRLRKINPGLVIGSRLRADETGARHFDANGQLMGDHAQGWERKLPASPRKNDWERVMPLPENQWGYHAKWTGHVKDSIEIIEMIARCAALDGNFAMNLGPKGDGSIRGEELKLMQDIGQWMGANGDAIYSCGASGLERQDWGWFTRKEKSAEVNAIVFNVPVSGRLAIQLNKGETLKSASLDKESLKVEEGADGRYFVHLPKKQFKTAFVVKLQISGGAQATAEAAKI
jgi:alpha-L-fucosidase